MNYASGTTVDAGRSRLEIETLLSRHGATAFAYATLGGRVMIGFELQTRAIKIDLPLPAPSDPELTRTPTGRARNASKVREEYEKEVRRRWRSLALILKAKLVAVDDGISTVEREFLADIVTDNGETMIQRLQPALASAPGAVALLPELTS